MPNLQIFGLFMNQFCEETEAEMLIFSLVQAEQRRHLPLLSSEK